MTTAGPASGTASCITKNTPVPTVEPTPNIISENVPMDRSSPSLDLVEMGVMGFLRHSWALRDDCWTVMGGPLVEGPSPGPSPCVVSHARRRANIGQSRIFRRDRDLFPPWPHDAV